MLTRGRLRAKRRLPSLVETMTESGEVWLGRINLHGEERGRPECDAAPYTTAKADCDRIETIMARIREVGGKTLVWT